LYKFQRLLGSWWRVKGEKTKHCVEWGRSERTAWVLRMDDIKIKYRENHNSQQREKQSK
jgi:hypothetical protein